MKGLLEKTPDPLGKAEIDEDLEIKREAFDCMEDVQMGQNESQTAYASPQLQFTPWAWPMPIPSICIRDNLRLSYIDQAR